MTDDASAGPDRPPTPSLGAGVTIDHVFLTRFNLPSIGQESIIRAQDGWLQDRVELFQRHTVPSVLGQRAPGGFHWLVFLDRESPEWLRQRLAPLVDGGVFTPVYGEQFTNEEVVGHARAVTGGAGDILLTTNLDNDDAIAVDFVARLHSMVRAGPATAHYFGYGLILAGGDAYLRHDPNNAFVSVAEPWEGAKTVWRDWHNMLHRHMAVHVDDGRPAWMQVVHGRNVSNRVRGRLVNPSRYAEAFPGPLAGVVAPARGRILRDRLVRSPIRETQEAVRRAGKSLLLRTVGKDGLDRVKTRLQRRR